MHDSLVFDGIGLPGYELERLGIEAVGFDVQDGFVDVHDRVSRFLMNERQRYIARQNDDVALCEDVHHLFGPGCSAAVVANVPAAPGLVVLEARWISNADDATIEGVFAHVVHQMAWNEQTALGLSTEDFDDFDYHVAGHWLHGVGMDDV